MPAGPAKTTPDGDPIVGESNPSRRDFLSGASNAAFGAMIVPRHVLGGPGFRETLAQHRDIDAVVIATPDHLHGVIAQHCMEEGKHVYVQKPLTWSVHEARVLTRVAREPRAVTQMGNRGHSTDSARRIDFVKHLMGAEPPKAFELGRQRPVS